jgi:hypothetical protein
MEVGLLLSDTNVKQLVLLEHEAYAPKLNVHIFREHVIHIKS